MSFGEPRAAMAPSPRRKTSTGASPPAVLWPSYSRCLSSHEPSCLRIRSLAAPHLHFCPPDRVAVQSGRLLGLLVLLRPINTCFPEVDASEARWAAQSKFLKRHALGEFSLPGGLHFQDFQDFVMFSF